MLAAIAAPVYGGVIQISNSSGNFFMNSQTVGLFSSTSPVLTSLDMATIHNSLNSNGVVTDEKITFMLVNTSEGIAFLTLIDQELGAGDTGSDGALGVASTGSSSLGMFINDHDQDSWFLTPPIFVSQTLSATFSWSSVGSGDGFAWTGLVNGHTLAFSFADLQGAGLDSEAFQFVSFDDQDGWNVVSSNGFKLDGTSVFTGLIVPAPSVCLLFVFCVVGRTRRRH